MTVITIKQFYPMDDCGYGPSEYAMLLTPTHSYYGEIRQSWEDGLSSDFDDYDSTGDKAYGYCLDKVMHYFADEKNQVEYDKWGDYVIHVGICDMTNEDMEKVKHNAGLLLELAEDNEDACFNVSGDASEEIKVCLQYFNSCFAEPGFSFGDWDYHDELNRAKFAEEIISRIK